MIDPDFPLHIGMIYGAVGVLLFELAVMFGIVWVVPAILLAVDWARGR